MGAKVRQHDWASTPLGPIAGWSNELRTVVSLVLDSSFPKCLFWGAELIAIHNDAFRAILGDKPMTLGARMRDVWAEVWDDLEPIVARAMAGEATFTEDFPLQIDRHGYLEQAYFTFCYSPVRDHSGAIRGMIDTVVETTGKFVAEHKLRVFAASLEQQITERTVNRNRLWQLSSDMMLLSRFDGTITAANPACSEVLGWSEDELVGQRMLTLIHPADLDASKKVAGDLEQGTARGRFDNRCRHKDGSYRWIAWTAVPGDGLINAVGRDCTAEREQADALHTAELLLRQSQKMEAVGQLTGGLAHDFNNLLASITGGLELLARRIQKGQTANLERYVDIAQAAARRAATLTHRMLAFSRRQTLTPAPTDINVLVAGMAELIRRTMGPAIALDILAEPQPWTAVADANQLENALLNLCINARDAMPDGGRLTVATANCSLAAGAALGLGLAAGEYLCLSVADTGAGMSDEVLRRAFDPFFTTKPTGQGTGLGLSMVYGFARQSGGQVRIESQLQRGTVVSLYLPRHDGPAHAAPNERARGAVLPDGGRGETALVIDDEPALRMLLAEALGELGYKVIEADDGPSGLAVLQSPMHLDLLITDVGLPGGLNGRQVADAGRMLRPGLKVLFITGYAESAVVGESQLDAGMQLLTKPFTIDALAAKVRALVAGSPSAPSAFAG